jgi:hypothetical protein
VNDKLFIKGILNDERKKSTEFKGIRTKNGTIATDFKHSRGTFKRYFVAFIGDCDSFVGPVWFFRDFIQELHYFS